MLDVGCGTGNLSLLFALADCEITSVDFSPAMLEMAQQRVPGARLLELDLPGSWTVIADQQFDVIASAYVFHKGELGLKLALLTRLREEHLASEGRIVVADISFTTRADMQAVQAEWEAIWDEDEFYWSAEGAIEVMRQLAVTVTHTPVPPFGRVYAITQKVADRLRT